MQARPCGSGPKSINRFEEVMPQIRISQETKEELDRLGKRLLRLATEEGAPVRVSRHQAGDFVSADETISWALRSLDDDTLADKKQA